MVMKSNENGQNQIQHSIEGGLIPLFKNHYQICRHIRQHTGRRQQLEADHLDSTDR